MLILTGTHEEVVEAAYYYAEKPNEVKVVRPRAPRTDVNEVSPYRLGHIDDLWDFEVLKIADLDDEIRADTAA